MVCIHAILPFHRNNIPYFAHRSTGIPLHFFYPGSHLWCSCPTPSHYLFLRHPLHVRVHEGTHWFAESDKLLRVATPCCACEPHGPLHLPKNKIAKPCKWSKDEAVNSNYVRISENKGSMMNILSHTNQILDSDKECTSLMMIHHWRVRQMYLLGTKKQFRFIKFLVHLLIGV